MYQQQHSTSTFLAGQDRRVNPVGPKSSTRVPGRQLIEYQSLPDRSSETQGFRNSMEQLLCEGSLSDLDDYEMSDTSESTSTPDDVLLRFFM